MKTRGDRIRLILASCCRPTTIERLVDPAIADVRTEYADALRGGRVWLARWIVTAGCLSLIRALVLQGLSASLTGIRSTSAEDRRTLRRTFAIALVAMIATTVLLAAGPLSSRFSQGGGWLVVYLVPNALVVSVPVGFVFGILWGTGTKATVANVRAQLLVVAVLCSAGSFSLMAWGIPVANQAFRQAAFELISGERRPVPRGLGELTIGELGRKVQIDTESNRLPVGTSRLAARAYYVRWMLPAAPVTLALVALVATSQRRRPLWTLGLAGVAALSLFYATMVAFEGFVRVGFLSPLVAAGAANLSFIVMFLMMLTFGRMSSRGWLASGFRT